MKAPVRGASAAASLRILSPVPGTVRALADVPDVVFAEELVGPGLAIEPVAAREQVVLAPADGTVGALHPHAFALELTGGRSVLVHLGIDTIRLRGEGFSLHVTAGQVVVAGQVLLTWSPVGVGAAGRATICPVVALQADPHVLTRLVEPGAHVEAGDQLFEWAG